MKYYILAVFLTVISLCEVKAQSGGNLIYEQNNRYKQNANYNEDAEKVWDFREDNSRPIVSNDREMIFTVNALMNVKADSYLAIFNIVQTGKTAKEANDIMTQKIDGFKKNAMAYGIVTQDIYTDMISLVPVYELTTEKKLFSTTYTEVPSGFEMQKNLHIRFTDESKLDLILTAAAENEIYDLIKVEYFVNDNDKKYAELRAKSIAFMKAKLLDFKQLGIELDTVYHIVNEKSSVAYPIDRYRSYQASTGTSIEALQKNATITTVKKPTSMFYNKLPYHKYDIVVSPAILEPAVQFTYSITLKYVIRDKQKTIEKHYMLVTPDGIIKPLEIK